MIDLKPNESWQLPSADKLDRAFWRAFQAEGSHEAYLAMLEEWCPNGGLIFGDQFDARP